MEESYIKFTSRFLKRDVQLLIFGSGGFPVLLFPTINGTYFQAKDFGLIEASKELIESGKFRVYCIETFDEEMWTNSDLTPREKIEKYIKYDQFLAKELVPQIVKYCRVDKLIVSGASLGGYHAANFAFKHPSLVSGLISMSGIFDMKQFIGDYYDDNLYFNNPILFMANEQGWRFGHMDIVLGTSEWDIYQHESIRMSEVFNRVGVEHWLNIWGWEKHDWPLWRQMFPNYLTRFRQRLAVH